MPQTPTGSFSPRKGSSIPIYFFANPEDLHSPLKPEELQVLRGQYEKEGEFVGLQTKFNYAWVRTLFDPRCSEP